MAVLAVAALIALALLTAPAGPPEETVVVVPADDGHIGAVVVQRGDNRQLLNQAYATSRSSPGARRRSFDPSQFHQSQ